ncbi:hypothetical protein GH740_01535 [Microbacterium sp. SYP-A9085]|uniref:hypothetical protein n=1 Tax=Microbacterium sp. SYP-A9085 TaxID=2664454 RepID=UPI00129A7970|nr:hypothetical protein [Microbacterium sp. SYP-A9085]MRH27996.1 hypothetical protein [Microbacterium sp. SYP-A9085]
MPGTMPLTSVAMRGQEIGEVGIELLRTELTDAVATHRHVAVTLQPELVIRESTVGR